MNLAAPDTPLTYAQPVPHSNRWGDAFVSFANTRTRMCAVIGGVLAVPALILIYAMSEVKPYLDFRVYLMGAHHLTDPNLYLARISYQPHLPFTYPPIAALFFSPLTVLPFRAATFVWTTLNLAAMLALISTSLRLARPDLTTAGRRAATLLLLGPVFAMEPVWQNFHFGQINFVLAVMVLYDVLERPQRRIPRGVLLGLATAIKLVPFVFVIYFVVRRQFRAALVSVATLVAVELVMFAVNFHGTLTYWKHYAVNASHIGTVWYNSNQSIRGASQRLAHEYLSHGLLTVLEALAFIFGMYVAVRVAPHLSQLATLVAVGLTGDLASPISWSHHLVWFLPLLVWLTLAHDRPRTGPWWALLLAFACWQQVIWWPPNDGTLPLHWNAFYSVVGNSYFFAMVATFCGMIVVQRRRGPAALLPVSHHA